MSATARQRMDWMVFFRHVRNPHGIRIRLPGFASISPVGRTTEKRLVRIVKAHCHGQSFALRRSFLPGPAIIDCVFADATVADVLAEDIGAVPVKPPIGWATGRELVADGLELKRLLKMGSESSLALVPQRPPVAKRTEIPKVSVESPAPTEEPTAVSEALRRIAELSPHQQAAALFERMTENLGK